MTDLVCQLDMPPAMTGGPVTPPAQMPSDELSEVRWVSLAEADELTAAVGGIYPPVREHLARALGK
jgi:hypothetical protein